MARQPATIKRLPVVERVRPADEMCLGKLTGIDPHGRPLVTYGGGPLQGVPARVATAQPLPDAAAVEATPTVLLVFENGDPHLPIIVGFVRNTFDTAPAATVAVPASGNHTVELNGKALIFEGRDEIVLKCGQGSITLRADGQIVLKGTKLVSRASQTNKIRGASVQIN
ncbi:MAG TPA: DUF6484 domain-containing protein [Povalibacter sp.]|nr:DUF6484 domain-containing protein [Povalibacter sp.]